jgi:hypothetical protein
MNGNFRHVKFDQQACGLDIVDRDACSVDAIVTMAGRVQVCLPPPTGMIGWWPFDDRGAVHLVDLIAGHDGHEYGPAVSSGGVVNRSRSFDGFSNYVWIDDPPDRSLDFGWGLLGTGDFSIDAWIRPQRDQANTPIHVYVIAQKMGCGGGPEGRGGWGYVFAIESSVPSLAPYLTLTVYGDALTIHTRLRSLDMPALLDGAWHHVAVTVPRQPLNVARFYLDGADADDGNQQTVFFTLNDLGNDAPLLIGGNWCGASDRFRGAIDEVEIFNRALSESEVEAIVRSGAQGKCKCDSSQCDDTDVCTVDRCDPLKPGLCHHFPERCIDGIGCFTGTCSPQDGGCRYSSLTCTDQDRCTADVCLEPVCVHIPIPVPGCPGGSLFPFGFKKPMLIP